MIPTKICGITNLDDAKVAVENGASAIGFIFYEKSPRAISIEEAKIISDNLTHNISRIGVFVNHNKDYIHEAISAVPLDMIQLHGDESPDFCTQFDVPVLKALRIKNEASLSIMDQFDVAGFLLDTFSDNQYGGTGETFDWSIINRKFKTPIILSGGLNPENILDAIDAVNPSGIDVNSGVESSPGIKNHVKIKKLFKQLEKSFSSVQVFKYSRVHEHINTRTQ